MSSDDRPVLVGMNNPYGADPAYALYPLPERATGWRLWQMLRLAVPDASMSDYRDAFDRRNLLTGAWSDRGAREAAPLAESLRGREVVLLDAKLRDGVARVLGRSWSAPCGTEVVADFETKTTWHWVPHPSGLCQWYNDEANRRRVGALLGRLHGGERGVLTA